MASLYEQINSLTEFPIIGGSDITLKFSVFDDAGSPVTLTGATCTMPISPFGEPTNVLTTITGVITLPNTITYIIPSSFTITLPSKRYMYQPIIVDAIPKTYRPAQGTFILSQAIA